MAEKPKTTYKTIKNLNTIWHPESTLLFKTQKDRTVVGRYINSKVVPLDHDAVKLCEKYGYKPDETLLKALANQEDQEEEPEEQEDPEEQEPEEETEQEQEDPEEQETEEEEPEPEEQPEEEEILPKKVDNKQIVSKGKPEPEKPVKTLEPKKVPKKGLEKEPSVTDDLDTCFSDIISVVKKSQERVNNLVKKLESDLDKSNKENAKLNEDIFTVNEELIEFRKKVDSFKKMFS